MCWMQHHHLLTIVFISYCSNSMHTSNAFAPKRPFGSRLLLDLFFDLIVSFWSCYYYVDMESHESSNCIPPCLPANPLMRAFLPQIRLELKPNVNIILSTFRRSLIHFMCSNPIPMCICFGCCRLHFPSSDRLSFTYPKRPLHR
jgi:hypothetical protein